MTLFYLSFAGERGFRGATVVQAETAEAAVLEATTRGLNPGGEIAIIEVPKDAENEPDVAAMFNRLLNGRQMSALGGKKNKNVSKEAHDAFNAEAKIVCEECNPRGPKK